jgi:hypothetical protein
MRLSLILALTMAVATLTASASAPSLTVGGAELRYTDAQMPFTMDGSFATLKRDATTMFFWHSTTAEAQTKWIGTLTNPLQTLVWAKDEAVAWKKNGFQGQFWLYNIYKISSTRLLGFVHREFGSPCFYGIGLALSVDVNDNPDGNGDYWRYLGDIVRAQSCQGGNAGAGSNIGGAPYLIVGSYFYVYYNEFAAAGNRVGVGVVRALVSDVISAALSGTAFKWTKYSGGGVWNQDGYTGLAANVIPLRGDVNSDAAHSNALNKYMLLVDTAGGGQLWLFLSDDGVNWPDANKVLVDSNTRNPTGYSGTNLYLSQFYSSFASLDPGASDDSLEVGANFTIFYPYKDWPNVYSYDELYRRQVTAGSPSMPAAPRSLQLSSLLRTAGQRLVTALALVRPELEIR